jgi:Fur family transcriptional regulator, ferric uptake regulator
MSRADPAPPVVEAPDLEAAAAVVRARGLRLSTARRLVLEALYAAEEPLTAEQIAGAMDVGSVYRNLEALEEIGLVRHVHLGHGPGLWALGAGGARGYLTCERCGAYTVVAARELQAVRDHIRRVFGYEASFDHFPVVGLCAACASATPGERRRR